MEIKQVGVVGCGTTGSGITQLCAQSGYQVAVMEINDNLLNNGLSLINQALSKRLAKDELTQQEMEATLCRIRGTTNIKNLGKCDLVIEAANEDLKLKKQIFTELDQTCPKHTILVTNTSCLSITDMAMATERTDRVAGLHFWNPIPVMKLLEIVKTILTSPETLETTQRFGESLGKTVVIAQDGPGFIVNRLLVPYLLDAIRMLEAGLVTREDIDTAVKLGLNHPMGPLKIADLIGLDVLLLIADAVYQDLKDPRFIPPVMLKKLVTTGKLGRKTGQGFYEYK